MQQWLPLLVSLPIIAGLLWSGWWTNERFSNLDELPGHYGLNGEATYMAPRRVMAWALPVLYSIFLLVLALVVLLVPAEHQDGSALPGVVFAGIAFGAAQCLVIWLHGRWARKQRP